MLIKENKVLTYLLYAIGEIALVVLGILIAVKIDDWNHQRADSNTLKNLLTNLRTEQEFNLKYLEAKREELNLAANSGLELLRVIESGKILDGRMTDSLVYRLIGTNSTNLSQAAVLDIISAGKIELIRNDSLRYMILSFGSKLEDIKVQQSQNNNVLNATMLPYLYERFAFAKMDSRFNDFGVDWPKGRFNSDLHYIFKDRKFESIVDDNIYRNLTALKQTEQLLSDIRASLKLINRELNNN